MTAAAICAETAKEDRRETLKPSFCIWSRAELQNWVVWENTSGLGEWKTILCDMTHHLLKYLRPPLGAVGTQAHGYSHLHEDSLRWTQETQVCTSPSRKSWDFLRHLPLNATNQEPLENESKTILRLCSECTKGVKACVPAHVNKEHKDVQGGVKTLVRTCV